jgi:hypothetical protein
MLPGVTADDAPPPSSRTLDDALLLLDEIERGAIELFALNGLPTQQGLYRRVEPDGEWGLLLHDASPEARWAEVLDRPPEAGFRYLSLADVARFQRPDLASVHAAAATLDRSGDLRRLLQEGSGEEDGAALLMFWSTVELMTVLFSGRRDDVRQGARRAVEWEIWRTEARRVWAGAPTLSLRLVAKMVVTRLGLSESSHTVRRRLSGHRPAIQNEPAHG